MQGRIVLYGATGYMGGRTAQAMVASGVRPVLAGRDRGRLDAVAARLSQAAGGDPYSFTAPVLAWAARTAAARGVRPAGALGPVEAFGLADLESACADAGFSRAPVL